MLKLKTLLTPLILIFRREPKGAPQVLGTSIAADTSHAKATQTAERCAVTCSKHGKGSNASQLFG